MVSFGLRPHVIAAWNSHSYKESVSTGIEAKEVMVEDWLTLNNSTVHHIAHGLKNFMLESLSFFSEKASLKALLSTLKISPNSSTYR